MTLTTVLPSLRRSIPDPIERRAWPEHTVAEVRDVTVAGVSLTRLAELEGTPCVMTGDLAHPHTQDARRRGIGMDVTVLVFRVTLRVDSQDARRLALVDCTTHDLPIQWEHCRLIGRASTAKQAMFSPSALDVAHASNSRPTSSTTRSRTSCEAGSPARSSTSCGCTPTRRRRVGGASCDSHQSAPKSSG